MEKPENNKQFNFLFILFIIISIIHIVYASITCRGLFEDGGFYLIDQLNALSANNYKISVDMEHPRFFMLMLMQLPVMFSYVVLGIKSKYALMVIFSFAQFAIPVISLLINYKLTKRTQKWDVFFWNIFVYGAIVCSYLIYSVTESIIGITFHFILWNYLASDIDYKKKDIVFIIFLIIAMFMTYEYVTYLGIMFFLAHFHYVVNEKEFKNQCVKTLIGFGALGASIYNIYYMFGVPGEEGEILRLWKQFHDYFPYCLHLNTLFIIAGVILLILYMFKKKQITYKSVFVLLGIFTLIIVRMFMDKTWSVYPMWETHLRTIPCWVLPIVFMIMYFKDVIRGKSCSQNITNFICIALICGIFQTMWQINHTFYWNKNIEYMKNELAKCEDLLYIPSEHEEIADFHNPQLRRYIGHGIYAVFSILFSDTYEQKTLLVNYDIQQDQGNGNYRNFLYVVPDNSGQMSVPYGTKINIKNSFWDLTNVAEALDKYNKKNKIQTNE